MWEGEDEEETGCVCIKFQKVLLGLHIKLLGSSLQVPEKLHVARGKEKGVGRETAHRE